MRTTAAFGLSLSLWLCAFLIPLLCHSIPVNGENVILRRLLQNRDDESRQREDENDAAALAAWSVS